ncbi:hypothetical protein, partial [Yersinia intermedia]|uniref:hypothetical protein n=1 Tax=Yersinia intermedia TaxID=631 RepID=UPI0022449594
MTKVTPQGLTALHATLSGHSVSLKQAIGAVSALLMLVCSASAWAADAPARPKHRVTLTNGQRAAQAAPVIEQQAPTPGADIPSTASSASTVAVVVSGKTFPVGSHFPQSGFV